MTIVPEDSGKAADHGSSIRKSSGNEPPAYDENPWRGQAAQEAGGSAGRASMSATRPGGSGVPASAGATRNVLVGGDRDVTCTDETINKDVNAMHSFLLSQTSIPPRVVCRIVGKHSETHVEESLVEDITYPNGHHESQAHSSAGSGTGKPVSSMNSAGSSGSQHDVGTSSSTGETHVRRTQTKKQTVKTVQVTAFDISIDLTQYLLAQPTIWTAADEELVYRGGRVKERWVGHTAARREANDIPGDQSLLKSSKSLKTWVKQYVDRAGPLKEFEWSKGVDGWDWPGIRDAIQGCVLRAGYSGKVTVSFDVSGRHVLVRPPGLWSNMYANPLGNVLLWFSLVKPYLLYYYKQGRWSIGGEVWHFRQGDTGVKEGEWFRMWESTIERAVDKRMTVKEVLKRPWSESAGARLEGYNVEFL